MKGFLFDVDQTLTNTAWPDRKISDRTKRALAKLSLAGKKAGICTGRQYAELRSVVLPLFPSNALHVVAGGGEVINSDGERLWSVLVPNQTVRELCRIAIATGGVFIFGRGDALYGSQQAIEYKKKLGWEMKFGQLEELEDWSTPLLCIQKITPELREAVQGRPEIMVKEMDRYDGTPYFDITAAGVTKALGVEQWCQLQGISLDEVVGFGDSENDLEFLEIVGWGIAVGNAKEAVKAAANEVIGHADHDGVAQYIESLEL